MLLKASAKVHVLIELTKCFNLFFCHQNHEPAQLATYQRNKIDHLSIQKPTSTTYLPVFQTTIRCFRYKQADNSVIFSTFVRANFISSHMKFLLASLTALSILLASAIHLCYAIAWIAGKIFHTHIRYALFGKTTLALLILISMLFLFGYFVGRWRTKTNEVTLTFHDLPSQFDGCKIVHISDLHLMSFAGHEKDLQKIVERINALQPDIICFTGDLIGLDANEIDIFLPILKQMKARHGIYSVLGNHDYVPYGHRSSAERHQNLLQVMMAETEMLGWRLLNDENETLKIGDDSITIAGIQYLKSERERLSPISHGDINAALQDTCPFTILLAHNPANWDEHIKEKRNVQLTLSGHTHAAQIRLFGWTPASLFFESTDGLYEAPGQYLYVNTGLGATAPIRIGVPQEITLITLKQE